MKDPDRWVDNPDVPGEVRELLEAGDGPPEMPTEQRRRIGAFVTRVAAGAVATSALFSTKAIAAALLVTAGGAVTWAVVEQASEGDAAVPAAVDAPQEPAVDRASRGGAWAPDVSRPATPADPEEASEAPVVDEPVVDEPEGVQRAAPPASVAPPPRRARSSAAPAAVRSPDPEAEREAPPEDPLAAEAAMLERARAVLESDAAAALAQADRHGRVFPDGQLAAERELIAIDALQRQGRLGQARHRAEALIARNPNGIYARRARRLVGLE